MYGERSRAQMREVYCGCKQPKSIHISKFAAAKVRQLIHNS